MLISSYNLRFFTRQVILVEYLKDFGWKPNRFTPTGQPIIDEGTLNKIKHIPEARMIAEFLLLQKRIAQINSWFDVLKVNRIHGRVITTGTITNRIISALTATKPHTLPSRCAN